jgi:hypothetical protein
MGNSLRLADLCWAALLGTFIGSSFLFDNHIGLYIVGGIGGGLINGVYTARIFRIKPDANFVRSTWQSEIVGKGKGLARYLFLCVFRPSILLSV